MRTPVSQDTSEERRGFPDGLQGSGMEGCMDCLPARGMAGWPECRLYDWLDVKPYGGMDGRTYECMDVFMYDRIVFSIYIVDWKQKS